MEKFVYELLGVRKYELKEQSPQSRHRPQWKLFCIFVILQNVLTIENLENFWKSRQKGT